MEEGKLDGEWKEIGGKGCVERKEEKRGRRGGGEGAEVYLSSLVTATRISNPTPLVTDPCSH